MMIKAPDDNCIPMVSIDADHMGYLLSILADYHTMAMVQLDSGLVGPGTCADTCYMLGNIEGRLLYSGLTQDDLDLVEAWEKELNDWKEKNNGQIIRL